MTEWSKQYQIAAGIGVTAELTNSLPLGIKAVRKTLNFARKLQNSGSDIVTEEDMTRVLGKPIVHAKLAQAFRDRVVQGSTSWDLAGSIMLRMGAGPTVRQAFSTSNWTGSFAMVVQCSFLCSLHDIDTLAAALVAYFQREQVLLSARTAEMVSSYPDQEKIRSTLAVCQEQTYMFDWEQYVFEAAVHLGYITQQYHGSFDMCPDRGRAMQAIHKTVFQGLVEHLPDLGRFEGRHIEINRNGHEIGICAIVVWAHYILGLNVDVYVPEKAKYVRFVVGDNSAVESLLRIPPQEARRGMGNSGPTVTVYDTTEHGPERIFTISQQQEDVALEGAVLRRVRGYGSYKLYAVSDGEDRAQIGYELSLIACGFALHIAEKLCYHGSADPCVVGSEGSRSLQPLCVGESEFFAAAKYLFDATYFGPSTYKQMRTKQSWIPRSPQGLVGSIKEFFDERKWKSARRTICQLAVVLLALCHVSELESCNDLRFAEFGGSTFAGLLYTWDGFSGLAVSPDTWFLSIIQHVVPDAYDKRDAVNNTALISIRGLSIFTNTLNLVDPMHLLTGSWNVKAGVPVCDGITKHSIIDGAGGALSPRSQFSRSDIVTDFSRSLIPASFENPRIGRPHDQFVVELRLRYAVSQFQPIEAYASAIPDGGYIAYTGYKELSDSLALVFKSEDCNHKDFDINALELGSDTIVIDQYAGILPDRPHVLEAARIWVCPTTNDKASRWYTLWWLSQQKKIDASVMLRGPYCCVACAVLQASRRRGSWCVVT